MVSQLKTLRFIFKRLYGKHTRAIALLAILGFVGGLFEGIGIGVLVPLFGLVAHQSIGADFLSEAFFSAFQFFGIEFRLRTLLILVTALFSLKAVVLFIFSYVQAKIVALYEFETKERLYRSTLKSNWQFLLSQKIGHLDHYIRNHVSSSVKLLHQIPELILDITSFLVYLFVALRVAWFTTLMALGLGAFMFFVFRPLARRVRIYSREILSNAKNTAHHFSENFGGLKTIKIMHAEDPVADSARSLFSEMERLRIKMHLTKHAVIEVIQPIAIIFISIVFSVSFLRPGFQLSVFAAVVYLIQRIFTYIDKAQRSYHVVNEMVPYSLNLIEFEDNLAASPEENSGTKPFLFKESLEFRSVGFAYHGSAHSLDSISLSVRKGEMIGIIGPSGAGKSTLVDLLLRLFVPSSGTITMDGRDIREITLASWREHIGYVAQDIFLKNETIGENIRFYNKDLSDDDIRRAIEKVGLTDVVASLPQGIKTHVGDRGVRLSAGQRQRIVLARILAKNPDILILDEATAALDNESEALIKKNIDELRGKMTIFVIAHRLSTVTDVDHLIVLDKGKIVEQGAPKKLLEDPSSYYSRVSAVV